VRSIHLLILTGIVTVTIAAFSTLSPRQAHATCLTAERGSWTGWVNHCSVPVWVNWDDDNSCDGWSCSDSVGPNRRSTATIGSNVRWCEWTNGRSGKGPC